MEWCWKDGGTMLDFPQKFWNERRKNSMGDLSKCRVYTEFADEIGSYLEWLGNPRFAPETYIYIGLYIAIYIGL